MRQAGVYTILNLVTGRCYVGSSVNVPQRWREHLSMLTRGLHVNEALQIDWTKYGEQSFSWVLVQACDTRSQAITAEQSHIDSTPDLYNAARRAGSGPRDGFKHTAEMNRKQSEAMKGRPKPVGFGAKISAWKRGRPNPAHSAALTGRSHSPEHCEAIRISHIGKKHSAETKAKLSAAQKGRVVTWGAKVSASKDGRAMVCYQTR